MSEIISRFKEDIVFYQYIEEYTVTLMKTCFPDSRIERIYTDEEACFEKNYLSIFFLLIYQKLGLRKNKVLFNGVINYLVRGIVTCTDNLMDHEDKFLLSIKNIGTDASTSQSIFLLIMHQTILDTYLDLTVKEGLITSEEKTKLKLILFTELFEIGFMESAEENKNEEFLSPDEIIEKVNHYRGARLLGLAFIAVLLLEENKELITNVRNGVSHIGSGLQLMDDISDIKKDTTERKRNYLASYLAGKYSLNYSMLTVEVNSIDFEKKYHADILLAFQKGIEFIKTGLDSLETVGINFSDVEVQELMKFIIRSRNLEESFGGVFNQ
jgi:hypothetical protein